MNNLDESIHLLGAGLLIILGVLSPWIENKRLKRMLSKLIVLVLGVLLADAFVHRIPNAIAGFIYGAHRQFYAE